MMLVDVPKIFKYILLIILKFNLAASTNLTDLTYEYTDYSLTWPGVQKFTFIKKFRQTSSDGAW